MTGREAIDTIRFRLPRAMAEDDLDRGACVGLAIRRAFPLPDTGSFADLLSALDEGCAKPV
jgi:uncharacterized membrane protein